MMYTLLIICAAVALLYVMFGIIISIISYYKVHEPYKLRITDALFLGFYGIPVLIMLVVFGLFCDLFRKKGK